MEGKNIDKLFKDRLGGDQVPYDPANWERMSSFLDENPIKRTGYIWDYIIAGTLLAIILFVSIFNYIKLQDQDHESDPNLPAARDITIYDIYSSSQGIDTKTEITLNEIESNDLNSQSNKIISLELNEINSFESNKINSQESNALNQAAFENNNFSNKLKSSGSGQSLGESNSTAESFTYDYEEEEIAGVKKTKTTSSLNKNEKVKLKEVLAFEDDDNFVADLAEENTLRNTEEQEVAPLSNSLPQEIASSYQDVNLFTGRNSSKWYNIDKKPKPFLDAFIGIGFMAKPDYLLVKGGISLGLDLNPNLFLRTGVTFSSQNTPRHAGYSFEQTVYGFGSDLNVYELEVQKTNSMSIPIEIGFRKNRNAIFAGVEVEKILASKGEFHLNPGGDDRILKEKGWIGNKAFLPEPTWNFLLGYEYYIGSQTIIGARIESAMSNYINSNEVEEFRSPGASNWGRAIIQIRQKF